MNIINEFNVSKKDRVAVVTGNKSLKDFKNKKLKVDKIIIYEDTDNNGEVKTFTGLHDTENGWIGTISESVQRCADSFIDYMSDEEDGEPVIEIAVNSGMSKSDREYLTLELI